jgi:hypothetical protein
MKTMILIGMGIVMFTFVLVRQQQRIQQQERQLIANVAESLKQDDEFGASCFIIGSLDTIMVMRQFTNVTDPDALVAMAIGRERAKEGTNYHQVYSVAAARWRHLTGVEFMVRSNGYAPVFREIHGQE